MITRDLQNVSGRETYRLLSGVILPRPIAWVTTLGDAGVLNLAPFSSFMCVFNPPVILLHLGRRSGGRLKDTHRNLRETGEAVVHIPDAPLLEAMHATGCDAPPEVSEVARLGLTTVPSDLVAPERLADAPVALECRFRQEISLAEGSDLLLLDVLRLHAAERIWNSEEDCADARLWAPIARLAGAGAVPQYARLGKLLSLGKPELP